VHSEIKFNWIRLNWARFNVPLDTF